MVRASGKPTLAETNMQKKKLDTKREIRIKSHILANEFASQLPPAEAPDPELEERMMLQFTRSRLSVGSTHMQGDLAARLRQALNQIKVAKAPTQAEEVNTGP